MTKSTLETNVFMEIAEELIASDVPVQDMINKTALSPAQFYRDFREYFDCTPTEYRVAGRQAQQAREEKVKTEEVFNFTVNMQQAGLYPQGMAHTGHGPMNAEFVIPLVVNGQYGFTAYVVPISGSCPTRDPVNFLRSEYRDYFNAQVVDTLIPYFHGQLDIAYLQTLSLAQTARRGAAW
jgi:hypothetical protein